MPSTIDILSPFDHIKPGPFIARYQDWIVFTLLLFFFWSVVGIALRKKFEGSRYFKVLLTAVSLMLAIGTYFAIYSGRLHLSLQGLGLFGAILLFVVIFFIIFGLMRSYGMRASTALPFGFVLFYISLWAVSPNILHNLADIFPPANGILILLFAVSLFKIVSAFFRHSRHSPVESARELKQMDLSSPDASEIDQELNEDRKEMRFLKRKTMRITKKDIKTVDDIADYLKQMIQVIEKKGNEIDSEEIAEITHILRRIAKKENILKSGTKLIKEHLAVYEAKHKKDIAEMEKRLLETKDKKQKKVIEEEIDYQRKMLQALDFIEKNEHRIIEFSRSFNRLLASAVQKLKSHSPGDALSDLEQSFNGLKEIKHIFEKQKELEKYLRKTNRRTISDLKKEKGR